MLFIRFFSLITIFFLFLFSTASFSNAKDFYTFADLNDIFETLITSVAIIGGFLAFLAIIFGGFKYITARGDPKAVSSAQSTLTWAFIGLAFIIIAWLILLFIDNFTNVPVTIFDINNQL